MENAEWVIKMQKDIHTLAERISTVDAHVDLVKHNLDALTAALIAREEVEIRRERIKRIVSFLTMGLSLVAGPAFHECLNTFVDVAAPIKLLMAATNIDEQNISDFVAKRVVEYTLESKVEEVLQMAQVEPSEFVETLRRAIELDPSPAGRRVSTELASSFIRGIAIDVNEDDADARGSFLSAVGPSPRYDFMVTQIDRNLLEHYKFHKAVWLSRGDFITFLKLLNRITDGTSVNALMEVQVTKGDSTPETKYFEPQVLASYLGYVDITKYFFDSMVLPELSEPESETLARAENVASLARAATRADSY